MKIKTKTINRKLLVTGAVLILVAASAGSYFAYRQFFATPKNTTTDTSQQTTESEALQPSVNYSAPTDQEISEGQEAKKKLGETSPDTPSSTSVEVGIANYHVSESLIEVRAFTPSVVEGGGICTATFTQADKKVTGQSEAFVDASTSQCRPITIPLSSFSSRGTWKLQVSYKSNKYSGTSPAMEIKL